MSTTTTGESMLVFFEGNRGGYTKNGMVPAWTATYFIVENDVEPMKSNVKAAAEPHSYLFGYTVMIPVLTTKMPALLKHVWNKDSPLKLCGT